MKYEVEQLVKQIAKKNEVERSSHAIIAISGFATIGTYILTILNLIYQNLYPAANNQIL